MPPIDVLKNYAGGLSPRLVDFSRPRFLTIPARTILVSSRMHSNSAKGDSVEAFREGAIPARRRLVPPFTPSHDIPRGIIQAIQSTFSYALMLAVM